MLREADWSCGLHDRIAQLAWFACYMTPCRVHATLCLLEVKKFERALSQTFPLLFWIISVSDFFAQVGDKGWGDGDSGGKVLTLVGVFLNGLPSGTIGQVTIFFSSRRYYYGLFDTTTTCIGK